MILYKYIQIQFINDDNFLHFIDTELQLLYRRIYLKW